ncbi:hypothetical protein D3C80_2019450 [compost metagenome]
MPLTLKEKEPILFNDNALKRIIDENGIQRFPYESNHTLPFLSFTPIQGLRNKLQGIYDADPDWFETL